MQGNIKIRQMEFTQQHTLTQNQYKTLIEEKLERARLMVQHQQRTERRQQNAWSVYKEETRSSLGTITTGKRADRIHERHGENVPGKTPGQGIDPVISCGNAGYSKTHWMNNAAGRKINYWCGSTWTDRHGPGCFWICCLNTTLSSWPLISYLLY